MKRFLRLLWIDIRYHHRVFEIWIHTRIMLMRVTLAGKTLKLAYWLSPRVIREYENQVLRTGKGVNFNA